MKKPVALLEIQMHLKDGNILKFFQNEPGHVEKIIGQIQARHLFEEDHIIMAGTYSMTAYPTSAISRVDIITELLPLPLWPFPTWVLNIQEIHDYDYLKTWNPDNSDEMERRQTRPLGERFMQYCELEMISGEHFYLAIHMLEAPEIEQIQFIPHFLHAVLHGERLGGGVMIINPAHVLRITFCPGTRELPSNAWPAHRVSFGAAQEVALASQLNLEDRSTFGDF